MTPNQPTASPSPAGGEGTGAANLLPCEKCGSANVGTMADLTGDDDGDFPTCLDCGWYIGVDDPREAWELWNNRALIDALHQHLTAAREEARRLRETLEIIRDEAREREYDFIWRTANEALG